MTRAERLRENRGRGRTSDAGQGGQRVEVAWEVAGVRFHADLRRAMQVARAAVVAKSRPQREHTIKRRLRKLGDRWQRGDESLEIREDRAHLRLLQHDFAEPDAVRSPRMLPG